MSVLLDTHAFLWYSTAGPSLSSTARASIADPAQTKFLSLASVWEMAVKHSIGKLPLALPFVQLVRLGLANTRCNLLPIELAHIEQVATLALHHRDPFDRLLIAQAQMERLSIISSDRRLDDNGIVRIW